MPCRDLPLPPAPNLTPRCFFHLTCFGVLRTGFVLLCVVCPLGSPSSVTFPRISYFILLGGFCSCCRFGGSGPFFSFWGERGIRLSLFFLPFFCSVFIPLLSRPRGGKNETFDGRVLLTLNPIFLKIASPQRVSLCKCSTVWTSTEATRLSPKTFKRFPAMDSLPTL